MFRSIADAVLGFFEGVITFLHDLVYPVFGVHSWGWAIIALTLVVRVFLLPLAIKQTRSMRAMQAIQPQVKELQKKYKVDRELMRKDPETYRARKQKLQQEQMALFQKEGVNPAASCLPLLAQAPVFIALFWTIRGMEDELSDAPFYFFTAFVPDDASVQGIAAFVSDTGWPGWLLIVLMSGSLFISQKQMMARNTAVGQDNPMAQQQKILLYVMPIFLAVVSFQFPLGLLLYWTTTNVWQIAQQAIILREVKSEADSGELADRPGGEAAKEPKKKRGKRGKTAADDPTAEGSDDVKPGRLSPGASSGHRSKDEAAEDPPPAADAPASERNGDEPDVPDADAAADPEPSPEAEASPGEEPTPDPGPTESTRPRRDHLPRRGGARD